MEHITLTEATMTKIVIFENIPDGKEVSFEIGDIQKIEFKPGSATVIVTLENGQVITMPDLDIRLYNYLSSLAQEEDFESLFSMD